MYVLKSRFLLLVLLVLSGGSIAVLAVAETMGVSVEPEAKAIIGPGTSETSPAFRLDTREGNQTTQWRVR